jgi:hypothetical protein
MIHLTPKTEVLATITEVPKTVDHSYDRRSFHKTCMASSRDSDVPNGRQLLVLVFPLDSPSNSNVQLALRNKGDWGR